MDKKIYHRNLSQQETEIIKGFRLPGIFKTDRYKQQNLTIVCKSCNTITYDKCILAEYSDNSWMLDKSISVSDNIKLSSVEDVLVVRDFCTNCEGKIDKEDIIRYYKNFIRNESMFINGIKHSQKLNCSTIYEPIVSAALRLASFEGNPELWESYVPKHILNLIKESN